MMRTVVLFDPSIGSQNVGDSIISESIHRLVDEKFTNDMVCQMPTQMPVSRKLAKSYKDADIKIVLGSNLLQSNMFCMLGRRGIYTHAIRQWDSNFFSREMVSNSVLFGCGWQNYNEKVDWFTKKYWTSILSKKYIHSVRDSYTLEMLRKIGITNVVNTGCPTTWSLTPEHCSSIPSKKSRKVVTTITDYRQDIKRDSIMLRTLIENYDQVFLWLQGYGDNEYFSTFDTDIREHVKIVSSNLFAYKNLISSIAIDYVGTRLHGGIYALQHGVRSIIVGIDNRAMEMEEDGLCIIPKERIEDLHQLINSDIVYDIHLHQAEIDSFLSQFSE